MPKLTPKNKSFQNGVEYKTHNPQHRALFFMGAKLHSEGNALRAAIKANTEHNEKLQKLGELLEQPADQQDKQAIEQLRKETSPEVAREIYLRIVKESLRQQYNVEFHSEKEAKAYEGKPEDELWIDTLGDYLVDEDLFVIVVSLLNGKSFTRESVVDFLNQRVKDITDNQLKKTAS